MQHLAFGFMMDPIELPDWKVPLKADLFRVFSMIMMIALVIKNSLADLHVNNVSSKSPF